MATVQELKAIGESMQLSGADLVTFVTTQQQEARDERAQQRQYEKDMADKKAADEELHRKSQEKEKERAHELALAKIAEVEAKAAASVKTAEIKLTLDKEFKQAEFAREESKQQAQFANEEAKRQAELHERNETRKVELARLQEQTKQKEIEAEVARARIEKGASADNDNTSKSHAHAKVPRIPFFEEDKDFMDSYLNRFERFAESQKWKFADWATFLSALLKGRALDVYSRLPPEQANDYDNLKEALLKRYQLSAEGFKIRFRTVKPEAGETPIQFLTRLDNYIQRWIELAKVDKTYEGLKALFIQEQYLDVCPKELALFLRERTPATLTDLGTIAEKYIEAHATKIVSGIDPRNTRIRSLQTEPRRCHLCGSPSHLQRQCPKKATSTPKSVTPPPPRRPPPTFGTRPPPTSGIRPQIKCFLCDRPGHIARNCFASTKLAAAETIAASELPFTEPELQETAAFRPARPPFVSAPAPPAPRPPPITQGTTLGTCRTHNRPGCTECIYPPSTHTCNALIAICQDCGQQHPVIADACRSKDVSRRMPLSHGTVGEHPVTVLRDTGCSTVVVRRSLVTDQQLTGREEQCILIDGTVRRTPVAEIDVTTPFFTGRITAVCMRDPLYDLIVGNVEGAADPTTTLQEVQAVQTRSQTRSSGTTTPLVVTPEVGTEISPSDLSLLQQQDTTLDRARELASQPTDTEQPYRIQRELLYRIRTNDRGEAVKQLALPTKLRHRVMTLAHTGLMSGHQGIHRTQERITTNFWWPGMTGDIARYCQSCDVCQRTIAKGRVPRVPLGRVPIIDTPFKRIAVDLVGPIFPATTRGHRYILTVVDYATRYPEAIPLKRIDTTTVAEALLSIFSRVGVPSEILSDQGTQFTANLMKEISRLLSVKQLTTTPYHPQCNGLVERFNGTLKLMLKRMCSERPKDWDRYVDPLLFAYREAPQESLGFSPFEMLYGRSVRGPIRILRELWSREQNDPSTRTTYEYVVNLRERLQDTWNLAHEQLSRSQAKQKRIYDYKTKERTFKRGDQVLILLPTNENKLLMQWKGPFAVLDRIEGNDYRIRLPTRDRIFHANLLKRYHPPITEESEDTTTVPVQFTSAAILEPEDSEDPEVELGTLNPNQTETVRDVKVSSNLTEAQQFEAKQLLSEYEDIFTDVPNTTALGNHEIHLTTTEPIRGKAYTLPHAMRETLDKEIDSMLTLGVIKPSTAAYASPVVMVKKPDGSTRVCVDYRKLNKVTIFDPEPMPQAEEIFAKLAEDRFFSKFDLSKGYWQVPMRKEDQDVTTFVCHRGLFKFTVMPFGLVNAPATFSRIMRRLLQDSRGLDNYLDDVLAHTRDWPQHLQTLHEFFERIRRGSLTLRPSKCEIGGSSVSFLGHRLSEGELHPRDETVDKIRQAPQPRTKKQLRAFLGLAGFYRKYVPNFAVIAAPLTDATRKGSPNEVHWSQAQENAFVTLKEHVSNPPILRLPDVSRPFVLQTDASNTGLGAILLQEDDQGEKHPIAFASRKLLPRETRYSTIERECLAIVWGIGKFQEYLYGTEFVLETDHQPLQYLGRAQFQNGRLMRWALALQPYRFLLRAIHGRDNVGADCLSRNPPDDE